MSCCISKPVNQPVVNYASFCHTRLHIRFKDERMSWHYNRVNNTSAIDQKQRYSINWVNATTLSLLPTLLSKVSIYPNMLSVSLMISCVVVD